MDAMIDDKRLKDLVKAAMVKVLRERPDLFRELIEDALEDAAFARAIEEGEHTELVSREEVLRP